MTPEPTATGSALAAPMRSASRRAVSAVALTRGFSLSTTGSAKARPAASIARLAWRPAAPQVLSSATDDIARGAAPSRRSTAGSRPRLPGAIVTSRVVEAAARARAQLGVEPVHRPALPIR